MPITPYLYFNGNCDDAFSLYKSVFGGEIIAREKYSKLPENYGSKPEDADKIMHITLAFDDCVLMGADIAGSFGTAPDQNGATALSINPKSRDHADSLLQKLSAEGGEITMAMQDTFWNSYFGTCTDRFGVRWMINLQLG